MSIIHVGALLVAKTADSILAKGLEVAAALGLPVSTWAECDPTRSLYKHLAEVLAASDGVIAEYVKSGFLSTASGDWLTVLASEVYGIERVEATSATPTITLTNSGGGHFELNVGRLIVRNSETNKTYHNTAAETLAAGDTVTFDLIADEDGSDSSVGVDEIDEIVAPALTGFGVVIDGSTVGLANDAESDEALKDRCRASRGALSPNGAADAYAYIALTPDYTGLTSINRARATGNGATGAVTLVIATPSGAADGSAVAAVQAAVLKWCTPLCVEPTTVSAAAAPQTLEITVYRSASLAATEDEIEAAIELAIVALFAATPIGGNGSPGAVSESELAQAIHNAFPGQIYRVTGLVDIELDPDEVPTLDSLSVTLL